MTENGFAYNGVWTRIDKLPGINDTNEKVWTLLGALMLELIRGQYKIVTIWHDTRLVEEWNEDIDHISPWSSQIATRLRGEYAKKFLSFEVQKLDRGTINSEIDKLKLI